MIEENISKTDLIKNINENRAILEGLLAEIPKEDMLDIVDAGWSIKDILSHIIAWEQNMVRWITITLEGGTPGDFPETRKAVDSLNEFQYQRDKEKGLEEVISEFSISFRAVLALAENMDEKVINDPNLFAWRIGRPIWFIIAANMYWHYQEHFEIFKKLKN